MRLFRSHIGDRSRHLGGPEIRADVGALGRQAEVEQDEAIARHEHVLWLEIAMDLPVVVERLKCAEELP